MSCILQYLQNLRRMVIATVSKLRMKMQTSASPSNGFPSSPSSSSHTIPPTLTSLTTTYDLGTLFKTGESPSRPQANTISRNQIKLNSSSLDSTSRLEELNEVNRIWFDYGEQRRINSLARRRHLGQ